MIDGKFGISDRNEVGFLAWYENENVNKNLKVGSRLKTPSLPIWVTCVNDQWGVLFNPSLDILKSHRAQNR